LDEDVLGVFQVSNPARFVKALEGIELPADEWKELEKLICDDNVGLLAEDDLAKLYAVRNRLFDLIRDMQSVSLILHEFKNGKAEFSVVLDASEEQSAAFLKDLQELSAIVTRSKLSGGDTSHVSRFFGKLARTKIDRFHVFHNWSGNSGRRINPDQKRSLVQSRSFRRAWNQVRETPSDAFVYFAPRQASELVELYLNWKPKKTFEDTQPIEPPDGLREIVGFCASIDFSPHRDESFGLMRGFLCFTVPRSGIALQWEALAPIDFFPSLRIPVYEFKGRNGDQNASKNGFAEEFEARTMVETSPKTEPLFLAIYGHRVANLDLASGYIERLLALQAEMLQPYQKMQKVESSDRSLQFKESVDWTRQKVKGRFLTEDHYRNLSQTELDRIIEYLVEARSLDSDWHLLGRWGDIAGILMQPDTDAEFSDYGAFIEEKSRDFAVRTKPVSKFFAIEAYSPLSWGYLIGEVYRDLGVDLSSRSHPKTPYETAALCGATCFSSLVNRYGTQLWGYSQNKSIMQIDVQVFQNPKQLFPDTVEKFGEKRLRLGR
jgi:hypothetical protein